MDIIKFLKTLKSNNIDVSLHKDDLEISFDGDELPSNFLNDIKSNKSSIIAFLKNLEDNSSSDIIQNVPLQNDYLVSSSQKRLWILSQFKEADIAYNLVDLFELHGDLDIKALESALKKVVTRHEILRTNFIENADGDVRQVITPVDKFDNVLSIKKLNNTSLNKLDTFVQNEIQTPFNLSSGYLFRAKLFHVSEKKYVFCFVIHHIITDGWSMRLLIDELFELYSLLSSGKDISPTPLLIQYKDYAAWQQEQLSGDKLIPHKNYWLDQFSGELTILDLPGDKMRPIVKTYNGGILGKYLGKKIKNDLKKLIQNNGVTLYMGLLSGVYALLYKYTRSTDITIGAPIAGRENVELEDQLGFYVNTLALRTKFSDKFSFIELLNNVKKVTMNAYDHQIYPFDTLVEELSLKRDASRNALFDIMVVLQNTDIAIVNKEIGNLKNLKVVNYEGGNNVVSKLDLTFNFNESDEDLYVSIEYNNDIYSEEFCARILDNLIRLFDKVLTNPTKLLLDIDYQGDESKDLLLNVFNNNFLVYESGQTLSSIFERQVLLYPDAISLRYKDIELSYKALNEKSNRLSSYLLTQYELSSQDLISIKLPRSDWQIISILAVLKSGCAYVPIDIDYPSERVDYIMKDSSSKLLIDEKEITNFIINEDDCSSENRNIPINTSDLAYVIYTSGTTGQPKGVMVEQGSVINLIESQKLTFGIGNDENILQFSNISFDASVEQIFLALGSGSCLTIIDKEELLSPQNLENFIFSNKITHLHAIPSLLKTLTAKKYPSLRRVISGGDTCSKELAAIWFPYHSFYNEYGPTETTVTSIMHLCSDISESGTLPIGIPIANTQVYILDIGLNLVPLGVVGDIYIGGLGLSRGYLNRPELTKEKFLSNPFSPGTFIYKTGDLGRWHSDGTIEFAGRQDDQVKIRGHRIELGEIENTILEYEGISTAVVLAKSTSSEEKELIAYIDINTEKNSQNLRAYLLERLPSYMVPSYYIMMTSFPMNSNGKIDRKQLPSPKGIEMLSGVEYEAPRTETEVKVVEIWSEILDRLPIGIKDDFFELGGHSLKATRLLSQIHKRFEVKLELRDLFTNTTIEKQADLIDKADKNIHTPIPPVDIQSSYDLSSSQKRLWILSQFKEANLAYNIPGYYEFNGDFDLIAFELSLKALINRHEIFRTVFNEDEEGDIKQFILTPEEVDFKLPYCDIRNIESQNLELKNIIQIESETPFDLSKGPLMRLKLIQTHDNRFVFYYVLHHIISDEWSKGVMLNDLFALYSALVFGQKTTLPKLKIQYKDFAAWQQNQLKDENLKKHRDYWIEKMSGDLPILEMPGYNLRQSVQTFNGDSVHKMLGKDVSQGLKKISQMHESTLFMGLLASVNILLNKYTKQCDIIIGSPIAGREHSDLENQIGFYVNTLALRTQFKTEDSFIDILNNVKEITLGAYEHQVYPFDVLVEDLGLKRDISRNALFDVALVLENRDLINKFSGTEKVGNMLVTGMPSGERVISKFDLTFNFIESDGGLNINLEYNIDIFDNLTISRMLIHMELILNSIINNPSQPINKLNFLGEEEKNQLKEFNSVEEYFALNRNIIELIEEQVNIKNHETALQFKEKTITYFHLSQRSNRIGRYLDNNYQINPDDLVGILMERSITMIESILGVWKAGGAYVPIDINYPTDRIDKIIKKANLKVLIIDDSVSLEKIDAIELKIPVINIDKLESDIIKLSPFQLNKIINPRDLAYVIFTSGSTGEPKGVMIEHVGMLNHIGAKITELDIFSDCKVAQNATHTFDISVWQFFSALIVGGKAVIYERNLILSPEEFVRTLDLDKITVLELVPSYLIEMLSVLEDKNFNVTFSHLQKLVLNAETLMPTMVKRWLALYPTIPIINTYGITEVSDDISHYIMYECPQTNTIPVLRKPIQNFEVHLVDENLQLVPIGVKGEILVSGIGVGRGYINDIERTKKSFLSGPIENVTSNKRIYRTGDLGRYLPDGTLEFLGRKDTQVKIKGNRIELGDIEHALLKVNEISHTKVIVNQDLQYLVAYFTAEKELLKEYILNSLKQYLPDYMLPQYYIQLKKFPLNANGKINTKKLPNPKDIGLAEEVTYLAPRNKTEEMLVKIWEEILGKQNIGISDNFFDVGGNSMKIIKLARMVSKVLMKDINFTLLFQYTTIKDLVDYLELTNVKQAEEQVNIEEIINDLDKFNFD